MKKIFKEIQRIMICGTYDEYRLIITNNHIELKLRPVNENTEEINFFFNNEDRKGDLLFQLENIK